MDWNAAVAYFGLLLYFGGFIVYGWSMIRGRTNPNPATWAQWACIGSLNALSYHFMSGGDVVKSLQAYGSAVANLSMFVFALRKGRFEPLKRRDVVLLVLGVSSILIWWWTKSATYAQLTIQLVILISILPTWIDTWQEPDKESPFPWLVICIPYLITGATVALRITDWSAQWTGIVLHVNCFTIQFVVALLALNLPQRIWCWLREITQRVWRWLQSSDKS